MRSIGKDVETRSCREAYWTEAAINTKNRNGFFVFPAKETLYYSGQSSNGKDVETDLNKDDIKVDFVRDAAVKVS